MNSLIFVHEANDAFVCCAWHTSLKLKLHVNVVDFGIGHSLTLKSDISFSCPAIFSKSLSLEY